MSWEWVALILGLVFNLAIIMIAHSDGVQRRLSDGAANGGSSGRTTVEIKGEVPAEVITRSTRPDAGSEW